MTKTTVAVVSTARNVNLRPHGVHTISLLTTNPRETSLELDSHADTCCVGKDALIIYDYDRPVTVSGYDPGLGARTFRTVSAVLEYTSPLSGNVFHIVIHQAIEIPNLDHHLLCPMQCRVNDVTINDCPKFLTKDPTEETHAIIVTDPTDQRGSLTLPLTLQGVTSYLPVSKPSLQDWNAGRFPVIELTSEQLPWDPSDMTYQQQEESTTDLNGLLIGYDHLYDAPMMISSMSSTMTAHADVTADYNFASVLESKVRVSAVNRIPGQTLQTKQHKMVDAPTLAKRWNIPIDRAKKTVKMTTQRGIRHVVNPSIARRFPTNDRMLRYNRLPHTLFTDTLIAGTPSQRGKKYA